MRSTARPSGARKPRAPRSRSPTIDAQAAATEAQLAELPLPPPKGPDAELWTLRRQYLTRQLAAMRSRIAMLQGRKFTFDEESLALYDAVAPTKPVAEFDAVLAQLSAKLPGEGPLIDRYDRYKAGFIIPKTRLDRVFQEAIRGCRGRVPSIQMPMQERFTIEYVTGKSWSGYNWYQGNFKSLIQINTDLPIYIDRAVDLACHEGYPGHHVYNVLLEKNLVKDRGWIEYTVYPLFSPQSLIAEGTANYGIDVAFSTADRLRFESDVLFPLAGLDESKAAEYYSILALVDRLSYAGNEAARQYLDGKIDSRCGRRLPREIRDVHEAARRAARQVHRAVPQLRDQLQPRQGPDSRLRREVDGPRQDRAAALAGVQRLDVVAAAAVGAEVKCFRAGFYESR